VFIVLYLEKFHDITAFVVFDSLVFYCLTVAAVYRLRFTKPKHERPYRCGGYPITPALFILVSIGFMATLLLNPEERRHALAGLAILAAGMPYHYWRKVWRK
jgi:APA family basic amino acid/polyamine antiporter